MRKTLFVMFILIGALLLSMPLAAQDNGAVIAQLVTQAQAAIEDGDLVTAQALVQGAVVLIDDALIASCETYTQVEILLGQVAQTDSIATASALLTTAVTLLDTCDVAGGGDDPGSGFGGFDGSDLEVRSPDDVLTALGFMPDDGTLIAEPDAYVIDLSDRDNTITRQRINEELVGDFVMGGLVEWGPGALEDECGVSFRYPDWDNTNDYYALTFEQQGTIYFRTRLAGEFNTTTAQYEDDAVNIGVGEINEIIVTGLGDTFTIYLNGEQVAEFDDDTFREGGIAVAMATFDESTDTNCNFEDFWVWNLDNAAGGVMTDLQPFVPEDLEFAFDYPAGWEDVAEFGARAYVYNSPDLLVETLLLAFSDDLRDNLAEIDIDPGEMLVVVSLFPISGTTTFTEASLDTLLTSFIPEIVPGYSSGPVQTETLPALNPGAKDAIERPLAYVDVDGLDMRVVLAGLDDAGTSGLIFIFADEDERATTMPAVRAIISTLDLP